MEKASVERKNTLIDDVEIAMEHIRHDIVGDLLDHVTEDLEAVEAHLHDFVLEMLHLSPEEVGASVLEMVEHLRDQVPAEAQSWMDSAIGHLLSSYLAYWRRAIPGLLRKGSQDMQGR
ncbi:MAG: hypothetical protein KGH60_03875 [Candidatus Micrarchaeota archaeon]|nr:hypothetical protein [Candidatus Micrarchaeota archaeon]